MKLTTAKAGPLTVRIVDDGDPATPPTALVVLCHGYGAPGTDLVGIAGELVSLKPALSRVRFAFPEAPLALDDMPFEGRAWWHIDVSRFTRAAITGEIEKLFDDVPPGMTEARKALHSCVNELVTTSKLPWSRVYLGGFSQGAMIVTDLTFRLDEAPAALAIFSGTLINRPEWQKLAPKRKGLKVLQSHGTQDPILPYPAALELKKLLEGAGLVDDFHSFRGGHGLDGDVIEKFAKLITP